ncbi:mobilization protein MbpA [Polaribacter glomeratus]|uniref:Mobilization protein n=1 Tax=Polaribacter glomeratus TaxID=102 RepID=A0A2S7WYH5_9FLAO|nr:mobilization protein MbpA [Polaribacter glomeratus]PQJ82619.1 hypothetical protein BTO16_08535 [Polaribacter glomeratus]TXD64925.1 hypothetical protein ESX12_12330 [Polaribacter glomeratus]
MKRKNNIVTKFRTSSFEKKLIVLRAKKTGLSQSEFCKKAVLEIEIKERLTEEQIEVYKMLITYHNNFKSIGNLIKKKHPDLYQKVFQIAEEIKTHLHNFK